MAKGQYSFVQNIQALFDAGAIGELTDRQLLERLKAGDRDSAELAFAILVRRHGPMVYHACCSILRDRHEAEDAFQATFLVLSRKSGSLWLRDSIGPWLFGVACRVASCARSAAIRRRAVVRKSAERVKITVLDASWDDRDSILHEELGHLPHGYRMAVVLCDLEGLTQEQAARQLGWPAGTVRSRLARGRERLRDRLSRRGLNPSVVPIGTSLARDSARVSLTAITVENALRVGAGHGEMAPTSSTIALMEGALRVMFVSKLKLIAAVGLAGGVLIGGTALFGHRMMGRAQTAPAVVKTEPGNPPEIPRELGGPPQPSTAALSRIASARLDAARRLRDATYTLFKEGEIDLVTCLNAQRRLNDVESDLFVKTVADRFRFQERRLAALKRLESLVGTLPSTGHIPKLIIESERLEAEEALIKVKAKLTAGADATNARLKVAETLRNQMRRLFAEGLNGLEEYLLWERRYNALAREVILLAGGNSKQLIENQLAAIKELKQLVQGRFDRKEITQKDVLIIEYYRLELEEELAHAEAETVIPRNKD